MFAAIADPEWVLGEKSLSRMGLSEVPITKHLFSIACIVCGALGTIPARAMMIHNRGANRLSGLLLLLGCLFLIGVALFPIDDSVDTCFHDVLAFLFFGSALLAMMVSIVGDYLEGDRKMALFTAVLVLTFFVSYFTTKFGVYEAIGVLALMVWLITKSTRELLNDEPYVQAQAV